MIALRQIQTINGDFVTIKLPSKFKNYQQTNRKGISQKIAQHPVYLKSFKFSATGFSYFTSKPVQYPNARSSEVFAVVRYQPKTSSRLSIVFATSW